MEKVLNAYEHIIYISYIWNLQQHWIDSLVNAPTLEHQKELWFATVGKWLLQANLVTRLSAFLVTNPLVLWFCAGVCKGQLNLIRKEDNIYK
jgi:betaine lipid synthase